MPLLDSVSFSLPPAARAARRDLRRPPRRTAMRLSRHARPRKDARVTPREPPQAHLHPLYQRAGVNHARRNLTPPISGAHECLIKKSPLMARPVLSFVRFG